MRLTLLTNVKHDGRLYAVGAAVDLPEPAAQALVEQGAAVPAKAAKKAKADSSTESTDDTTAKAAVI